MQYIFPRTVHRLLTRSSCLNIDSSIKCFYRINKCRHVSKIGLKGAVLNSFNDNFVHFNSSLINSRIYKLTCRCHSIAAEPDESNSLPARPKGKIFFELENEFFHSYLENNPNYSETIHSSSSKLNEYEVTKEEFDNIVKEENWTVISAEDYLLSFLKACCYCQKRLQSISDPVFSSLCDAFLSKCIHFTDDQVVKCFVCLQNWPEAPGVKDENFLKVWKALDSVCVMRRMDWDLQKTLYMMDLWYSLKLTRLSEFVMKSVLRCINKARRLNQHGLVQLMFYLNTTRKVPNGQSAYELEFQLSKLLRSLTIEEIGIVCAGFFKTQTRINSAEMIDDIIFALIQNRENVDSVSLASISKLVRYTQKEGNRESIKKMLDAFSSDIINKHDLQVSVHVTLVTETRHISHIGSINNLVDKFLSSPIKARLKDMEKIARIISLFDNITNQTADDACRLIISELEDERRERELHKHPSCLLRCLSSLSLKRFFSEKLASMVLVDDYVLNVYDRMYTIGRAPLVLDQNIGLEFPIYNGNRLSQRMVNYLAKKHSSIIPGMFEKRGSHTEKSLRDLMATIRTLTDDRDDFWHCTYFLPHFSSADVLIHVSENNELVSIPAEIKMRQYFTGCIKPPGTLGHWLLFVVCNRLHQISDNQLTGEQMCKIRQLQSIGYSPILIPYFEFGACDTQEKRLDYIKEKINTFKTNKSVKY